MILLNADPRQKFAAEDTRQGLRCGAGQEKGKGYKFKLQYEGGLLSGQDERAS